MTSETTVASTTPQDHLVARLSDLHAAIDEGITEARRLVATARGLPHHSATGDMPEDCQYEYTRWSLAMLAEELREVVERLPEPRAAEEVSR